MLPMKRFCIGLVVLAAPTLFAQTAALPASAALLGPDTLAMLIIDNVQQAQGQLEKTRLHAMYKDPAMQPFVERIKQQLDRAVQDQGDELLRLLVQDDLLPTGRVLLAARLPEDNHLRDSEPSFLVLVQWGQNNDRARTAIERRLQKQIDDGTHRSVQPYRGFEIITMLNAPAGSEPDTDPSTSTPFHYCFANDSTLMSSDLSMLQFTLGQLSGAQSRTLADDANYQRARRAVGPTYDVEVYFNLKMMIERMLIGNDADSNTEIRKDFAALGIDGLSCIMAALDIASGQDTNFQAKAMLATDSPRRGILKMLELTPKSFRPPLFVDPQAGQLAAINLNIPAAAEELFRTLAAMNPMFAAVMNNPVTPPQPDGSPGVILKDDLLDNLGDQITYFSTVETDPAAEMGFTEEQVFAIAVRDAERLSRAVGGLHSQFIATGRPELQRQYLGYTLYSIPITELFMPGMELPGGVENAMAIAITQTHLLWGGRVAIEKAIQRQTEPQSRPLHETVWYRRAMSQMPSDAGSISIENSQLVGQQAWKALKSGQLGQLIQLDLSSDALAIVLQAFESLPEFDQVRQYFGLSLGWVQTRPDGFFMESKTIPAPPASN